MKQYQYLFLTILLAASMSCNKFLDTKPTSFGSPSSFYENATQLQTALNSVYDVITNGSGLYGPYGTNLAYRFAITCDENIGGVPYNEPQFIYDASTITTSTWTSLYAGIQRDNLLLASIDNPSINIDSTTRNVIKGQALFLRGYFYYWLVVLYGDVPLLIQPPGSINGDVSVARTPVKDVYSQILKDMTTAETLLGNAGFTAKSLGYAEKVTVDAVWGFLAKVCLTMASPGVNGTPVDATKYQDAIAWANKLIASSDHGLNPDYTQVFKNLLQDKYDVSESIWEAGLYGTTATEGSSFVFYNTIQNSPGGAQATTYITRKLYTAYAAWDSVRLNWNCPNYSYKSRPTTFALAASPTNQTVITNPWSMYPGKWRRIYENTFVGAGGSGQTSYNSCNMPLLRMADVYLMKAEAENSVNGPTQAAYAAINAVRRRAFKVSINTPNIVCDLPSGLTKSAFADSVKMERMRELCFEGIRKWDEIRWGTLVSDMQNLLVLANNTAAPANVKTICSRVSSNKYFLLPISNSELQLNPKLTQNPGW